MEDFTSHMQSKQDCVDVWIVVDDATEECLCCATKYENGNAIWSVTTVIYGLPQAAAKINSLRVEIERERDENQLVLPDMGDWQIHYHKKVP